MTKKSENRKVALKSREWDRILRSFNRKLRKFGKKAKNEFSRLIRFVFCYKPEDNMDLLLHIIFLLSIGYAFWYGSR